MKAHLLATTAMVMISAVAYTASAQAPTCAQRQGPPPRADVAAR